MTQILAQPWVAVALGLIIGSFLNVVIHRLPRRKSLVRPGSSCPRCGAAIRWYQNVPVLSYLALRGRCASCGKRISVRYPLVELTVAGLFLLSWEVRGPDLELVLRGWPFLAICVAVTLIDLDHRIIPDRLNLFGAVVGLATAALDRDSTWTGVLLGGAVGFGLFYGFAWLYHSITGRSGLGGGDIKFLGVVGLFLGVTGVFWTIFLSSILGSLVGIGVGILSRGKGSGPIMRTAIPYGPFLALGAVVYYFLRENAQWLRFTTLT